MGSSEISMYGDADRLVADLRYAQSLAMTRAPDEGGYYDGKVTVVTTDTASDWNGWYLPYYENKNEEDKLRFADGDRAHWEIEEGTAITPDVSLTFEYPKGKVVNAASDPTTIKLQRGDNSIIINVYSETGYVEIQ